jgi:hypothetical protein
MASTSATKQSDRLIFSHSIGGSEKNFEVADIKARNLMARHFGFSS